MNMSITDYETPCIQEISLYVEGLLCGSNEYSNEPISENEGIW